MDFDTLQKMRARETDQLQAYFRIVRGYTKGKQIVMERATVAERKSRVTIVARIWSSGDGVEEARCLSAGG